MTKLKLIAPKPWSGVSCLCGSGETYRKCCRAPDGLPRPKPFSVAPPGPKTGFCHPKCYMRSTNDCSDKISLEHGISQSILSQLNDLTIRRSQWGAENDVEANPKTLGAKVLCERHNNNLTPLDDYAGQLFKELTRKIWPTRLKVDAPPPTSIYVDGPRLEAWAVKVFAADYASRQYTTAGLPSNHTADMQKIIPAIHRAEFSQNGGLSYADSIASAEVNGFQYYSISNFQSGKFVGIHITICTLSFTVVFDPENADWAVYALAKKRPRHFVQQHTGPNGGVVELYFGWPGKQHVMREVSSNHFRRDGVSSPQWPYTKIMERNRVKMSDKTRLKK